MDDLARTMRASGPQRRAFVSFLLGAGDYVKGVVALAKSLRAVRSAYPLVVAVTECVPRAHRQLLLREGCAVREIEKMAPPAGFKFALDYYAVNYSKLRIWQFDDYDKLIYLDADMLLFQNIDELFDSPPGTVSGVMDCFCEATWSQCLVQYKMGYCQQAPHRTAWPAGVPKPAPYFNAGLLVFEPSAAVFKDMMDKMAEWPPTPFAEQDFLNRYFEAVYRPLPPCYNLVLAMLWRHPENVGDVSKVKNVHYCAAGSKPWKFEPDSPYMDLPDVRRFVAHWVKIYNSDPSPSPAAHRFEPRDAAARPQAKAPLAAVAQQSLLPKGITA